MFILSAMLYVDDEISLSRGSCGRDRCGKRWKTVSLFRRLGYLSVSVS